MTKKNKVTIQMDVTETFTMSAKELVNVLRTTGHITAQGEVTIRGGNSYNDVEIDEIKVQTNYTTTVERERDTGGQK